MRTILVELTEEVIDAQAMSAKLQTPEDGAVSSFVGVVRNHADGRNVTHLEYTAYAEMALKQMREICEKAAAQFGVARIAVTHRLGALRIGDASIAIVVASAHRREGLDAVRYLIDTIKEQVPIWKKEFFADGSRWVGLQA